MGKKQAALAKNANQWSLEAKDKRHSIVAPKGSGAAESDEVVMDDEESAVTLQVDVTRETLEGTPVRALTFLKAIGTSASIRASMARLGYRAHDHQEGWKLLHGVSGYQDSEVPLEDTTVRDAIRQIDDWDEGGFQIVTASLKYRFPEQASFLLNGLKATTGAAAVLGVKELLDRLDALESGRERANTREKDQAALALLAQRGVDKKQRNWLRGLLGVAESAPEISLPDVETVAKTDAAYVQKLTALRAWFEEWTGIARVAVKRRDYLIRLGLARRHPKGAESGAATDASGAKSGSTS